MAKTPAPAPKEKAKAAPAEEKMPFGVAELAEALGIEPTSVRVKLRNLGIEKDGRSYGWPNQKAFDAVVKQCKAAPEKPTKAEEAPKAKPKAKAKAA